MFENPEIAIDALPSADAVDWQSLHARYIRRLQAHTAIVLGIAAIAVPAASLLPPVPFGRVALLWIPLLLVAVVALSWPTLAVPRQGYALRAHDILFKKGVLWRSVTAVPFNRIQHVETSSTPLDRKFGLATLQLYTAGGSGGDLKISGLGGDIAERLRLHILEKAGASIESD